MLGYGQRRVVLLRPRAVPRPRAERRQPKSRAIAAHCEQAQAAARPAGSLPAGTNPGAATRGVEVNSQRGVVALLSHAAYGGQYAAGKRFTAPFALLLCWCWPVGFEPELAGCQALVHEPTVRAAQEASEATREQAEGREAKSERVLTRLLDLPRQ